MTEPETAVTGSVLRFARAAVGYRGRAVLHDVTFDLGAGRTAALVGPNGGGKSTLIRSVLGMADVVEGTVTVLGAVPGRALGQIAYVPQLDTLDADFPVSAAHVVLMGRYRLIGWWRPTRAADRRIAEEALDRVGLAGRARDRFGLLSGGQRQRVLVARALAAQPRLLLLDEPFNGVDAVSQAAILRVLAELAADGTAVVISTHDLSLAGRVADLVCLVNGRQYAAGRPGETLTAGLLRQAYGSQAIELGDGRTVLVEP
ncbi:MAG: manganese/zinc/iron transport system binding protein [Actinoplanes sp.]|nr:manganese/zinc/iron transport system binding protein [Actinoplanes sp.]